MKGLMFGTILKITPGARGLGWKKPLHSIFLKMEKHHNCINEAGRRGEWWLKSVGKANRPNHCTLASYSSGRIPAREDALRELSLLSHWAQPCPR